MIPAQFTAFRAAWLGLARATRRPESLRSTHAEREAERRADQDAYWLVLKVLPIELVITAARRLAATETTMPTAAAWLSEAYACEGDHDEAPAMDPDPNPDDVEAARQARDRFIQVLQARAIERPGDALAKAADRWAREWTGTPRLPRKPHCSACDDSGWYRSWCEGTEHGKVTCGSADPCDGGHEFMVRCHCLPDNPVIEARRRRAQARAHKRRAAS